jgi:hypothetical protein
MEGGDYEITALDTHPTGTALKAILWTHVFILDYDKSYNHAITTADMLPSCDCIHLFVHVLPRVGGRRKGNKGED